MKRKLALWLWRLAFKLAPELVPEPPTRPAHSLPDRSLQLVRHVERMDASGEFKRHKVYAQLLKEFPGVSKREVSKEIEDAVEKM